MQADNTGMIPDYRRTVQGVGSPGLSLIGTVEASASSHPPMILAFAAAMASNSPAGRRIRREPTDRRATPHGFPYRAVARGKRAVRHSRLPISHLPTGNGKRSWQSKCMQASTMYVHGFPAQAPQTQNPARTRTQQATRGIQAIVNPVSREVALGQRRALEDTMHAELVTAAGEIGSKSWETKKKTLCYEVPAGREAQM